MSDINLLPEEKQPLGKFLTWVLTFGRYIVIGTEIIVLLVFLSRFKFDRELTDLHESINQKQTIILAAQNLERQVRLVQNQLAIIKKLEGQRQFPPELLQTLSNLMPNDITLTDLSIDNAKLTLTASALSNEGFRTFMNNLSASGSFGDISLDNVSKDKEGLLVFRLTTALKNTYGQ